MLGLLVAAQVPQFSPFSADMQMISANPKAPKEVTGKIFLGDNHMRINLNTGGPGTAMITDFGTKTVDILILEPKMYMEHKAGAVARPGVASDASDDLKPFDPENPCANQPDVTCKKIGVETVSGRTCDHWEITDKNGKVSNVWVDEKLHFPIKMTSPDTTIILSNITEGPPDAVLFQVPADFRKMDINIMMQKGAGQPPQN